MSGIVPNPHEKDPAQLVRSIRDLFAGRSNATGTVTLTANTDTTTVNAINCAAGSKVFLFPYGTANAATEFGAGSLKINSVAKGSFVVGHANNAQTDRTFYWIALG